MPAPDVIKRLVDNFARMEAGAVPPDFDERQLQQSYLEPLLEALGWNTRDPTQVIVEKRVRVRDTVKFADYALLVGGKPQLVIETKDFRRNIDEDDDAVFQLKRYGYNLPCDFGVLTNFGEWVLYDTGLEPVHDNPARWPMDKYYVR